MAEKQNSLVINMTQFRQKSTEKVKKKQKNVWFNKIMIAFLRYHSLQPYSES